MSKWTVNFEMFGNENETYMITKNGKFLVTSVDRLEEIQEVQELPNGLVPVSRELLSPDFFESFTNSELTMLFD